MVYFYAFLGMICWGLAPLFGKMALYNVNPVTALSLRTILAAALVLGWLVGTRGFGNLLQVSPVFWFFILAESLLATLLGDLAYFAALKKGNINQVTLIVSSSPVVTILFSYIFFGETLNHYQILGALLIGVGLFLLIK
ncbi:EamA family transporter [Desulfotruncus alcoholivorax]|uniref:EamA family transporter n=1 Tax=Desulfotruncus alcoholivorax TaxID=265477 RepID=UPI00041A794C|nr:EamA family transporter [Desulfotruncus alcoholivorax]